MYYRAQEKSWDTIKIINTTILCQMILANLLKWVSSCLASEDGHFENLITVFSQTFLLATRSKFLTFASASTSELVVCKLDGVKHILWFDSNTSLLALVLASYV